MLDEAFFDCQEAPMKWRNRQAPSAKIPSGGIAQVGGRVLPPKRGELLELSDEVKAGLDAAKETERQLRLKRLAIALVKRRKQGAESTMLKMDSKRRMTLTTGKDTVLLSSLPVVPNRADRRHNRQAVSRMMHREMIPFRTADGEQRFRKGTARVGPDAHARRMFKGIQTRGAVARLRVKAPVE